MKFWFSKRRVPSLTTAEIVTATPERRTHVYKRGYIRRVGACLTQALNTIVFLSKNPCESLSARSWRNRRSRWFGFVHHIIDAFFHILGEADHCQSAYHDDYIRALAYVEDNYNELYSSLNKETQLEFKFEKTED
jgi:hypothetical protein